MILRSPYPPFLRQSVILRIDARILAMAKAKAQDLSKDLGRRVHPGEVFEDALLGYLPEVQFPRPTEAQEVKRDPTHL